VLERRSAFEEANLKANEFLYRRVDVEDVVSSHLLAMEKAPALGFGKFIITATTPFTREDARELGVDAAAVMRRRVPEYEAVYAAKGWKMLPALDRVYDNERARTLLGWTPQYDFARVLALVSSGADPRSELAGLVGAKGYHRSPGGS
jgi:UDP-glucose 4-epimerase